MSLDITPAISFDGFCVFRKEDWEVFFTTLERDTAERVLDILKPYESTFETIYVETIRSLINLFGDQVAFPFLKDEKLKAMLADGSVKVYDK